MLGPFVLLLSKPPMTDSAAETSVLTASHWGIVRASVRDGRIVRVTPFELDRAPSPNLTRLANLPYSPSRIRYPMVREGYLKFGPASRENRGKEKFVRVSWDEALDLVASEIRRVYEEYGPSAVFGRSYGWMSTGKVNGAVTLQRRLLNLMGGFVPCENSYSTAAVGKILPYVVGTSDPRSTSWEVVLENTECVVFWGADPLVTNDVDWLTTLHQGTGYLRALKEKGIRTVNINPIRTDTAEFLGSEQISPRPGTDCALMLGMIHELVRTNEADLTFLQTHTSGWREFLDYVEGKTDGVAKTPVWAESKCGVPAEKIAAFAHDLKAHRTMLMPGWGFQRIQYGEQSHWMMFALAAVLGQIGLPGGGIGTNYHYSSGGTPVARGPVLGGISGAAKPAKVARVAKAANFYEHFREAFGGALPVARFADCFHNPGKTIDFNGRKVTYPDVRLVMWAGGNPFAHQPDTENVRRAWKRPETVIVTDTVWTATARHADIVLPAATFWEHDDITSIGTYSNDGIVAMHRAIPPQWESKTDYAIFSALAERLGCGEEFTEGLDEQGWIRRLYEEAKAQGDALGVAMPEFDEFWEKCFVLFDAKEKDRRFVAFEDFRKDPKARPLSTESGLIELYSPKIASYGYDDCLGHPGYFEPSEGVNTAKKETTKATKKATPLALMSVKSRRRLHSQLDGTLVFDDPSGCGIDDKGDVGSMEGVEGPESVPFFESAEPVAVDGREPLWIHPTDAAARGIRTGDVVLVANGRGRTLAGAYVTDRVMEGVVVLRHGAWYAPVETEDGTLDLRGNSNTLTLDRPTSKLACGNIASTALVEVSRWTGDLRNVYVFEPPAEGHRAEPV